jgi:ParB-like chromosome segregation protein Spo0J
MHVEQVDIGTLKPDPANARKHSKRNLDAIAESLRQFGQQRAAVIRSDGTVLAGNGMLDAARALGWTQVSVTVVPDEWTDDQARAYALADNRAGELAEWDTAVLAEHLASLDEFGWDIESLGFPSSHPTITDIEATFGALPDGDRPDATQMTFTLVMSQAETVQHALEQAKAAGPFEDTGNSNSNGNALALICSEWLRDR